MGFVCLNGAGGLERFNGLGKFKWTQWKGLIQGLGCASFGGSVRLNDVEVSLDQWLGISMDCVIGVFQRN